jgi:hypothetical protein
MSSGCHLSPDVNSPTLAGIDIPKWFVTGSSLLQFLECFVWQGGHCRKIRSERLKHCHDNATLEILLNSRRSDALWENDGLTNPKGSGKIYANNNGNTYTALDMP